MNGAESRKPAEQPLAEQLPLHDAALAAGESPHRAVSDDLAEGCWEVSYGLQMPEGLRPSGFDTGGPGQSTNAPEQRSFSELPTRVHGGGTQNEVNFPDRLGRFEILGLLGQGG